MTTETEEGAHGLELIDQNKRSDRSKTQQVTVYFPVLFLFSNKLKIDSLEMFEGAGEEEVKIQYNNTWVKIQKYYQQNMVKVLLTRVLIVLWLISDHIWHYQIILLLELLHVELL